MVLGKGSLENRSPGAPHIRRRHFQPPRLERISTSSCICSGTRWSGFVLVLDYDVEIRGVICSINAIESVNARYRREVRDRGHFPAE
jgi:transposase-like protein